MQSDELVKLAHIESRILPFRKRPKKKFTKLLDLPLLDIYSVDYLWTSTWFLNSNQPLWSDFMQMTQDGDHHGPSSIISMPMIDQKSTDPMCILSTMDVVCTLAQKYSVVLVLTFDQPLYWKAMELQASQESESTMKSCVLRLGGFHMCMSFLGTIGHIMQGSGLSSISELIYAEGSVPAIMGGKEMSRGTRAHILLYGTLMGLIILKIFAQNTSNVFD